MTLYTSFLANSVPLMQAWVTTQIQQQQQIRGLSLRVNYTDRAIAVCRQSYCKLLPIVGCHMVGATHPDGRIFGFLDRSR
jgi:hypothetical protein